MKRHSIYSADTKPHIKRDHKVRINQALTVVDKRIRKNKVDDRTKKYKKCSDTEDTI
jgi:hypothetical protein